MVTITTKKDFMQKIDTKNNRTLGFINHFLCYMRYLKSGKKDLFVKFKLNHNLIYITYDDYTGADLSIATRKGGCFTKMGLNMLGKPGYLVIETKNLNSYQEFTLNVSDLLDFKDPWHGSGKVENIIDSYQLPLYTHVVIVEFIENMMVHGYAKSFKLKKIDDRFSDIVKGYNTEDYYMDVIKEKWFKDEYVLEAIT